MSPLRRERSSRTPSSQRSEIVPGVLGSKARGAHSRDDDNIGPCWELLPIAAKPLSNHTLHSVSRHRATYAAADNQTEPGVISGISQLDREPTRGQSPALRTRALIVAALANASVRAKALRSTHGVRGMRGQGEPRDCRRRGDLLRADRRNEALPALRAPPFQYEATGLGAHASTKAVGSLPTDPTRLKGALHGDLPARWGPLKTRPTKLPTRDRECQDGATLSFPVRADTFW